MKRSIIVKIYAYVCMSGNQDNEPVIKRVISSPVRGHLYRANHRAPVYLLWPLPWTRHRSWGRNRGPINLLWLRQWRQGSGRHNIGLHSHLSAHLQILLGHKFVVMLLLLSNHRDRRCVRPVRRVLLVRVLRHSRRIVQVLQLTESWWLCVAWLLTTHSGSEGGSIVVRRCNSRFLI